MAIEILALEKNLFFAVKMRDTLSHHEMNVTTVRTLAAFEQALASKPALTIVNLATPGVDWEAAIRSARAQGLLVLAFGAHMDMEAMARARQAGANRVVANSKFANDMPGVVKRILATPTGAVAPIEEADEDETA